ncbi:hypothetical protein DKM44_01025 [Deinococcus irradiatisoli]|uniref:Uncharacterized protein n=1 Tax=Deinococcus irradiatisoli TaxID=2202254 RepID=A0A2Z3JAH3_9DEIO|nr:hypothetical protein DKM44_01025 [Deinococcus irradiatisoli]
MPVELERAIEGLYTTFERYPLPVRVDMSPYRDSEAELGAIRRRGLRQLTASDLNSFAFHAMTAVGDSDLFRYTLPRLLELLAQEELAVDAEIVIGKLSYAGWEGWPESEQRSIRSFLMACWLKGMNCEESCRGMTSVLFSSRLHKLRWSCRLI